MISINFTSDWQRRHTFALLTAITLFCFAGAATTAWAQGPVPVPVGNNSGLSLPQMITNFFTFLWVDIRPPACLVALVPAIIMMATPRHRVLGAGILTAIVALGALPWVWTRLGAITGTW